MTTSHQHDNITFRGDRGDARHEDVRPRGYEQSVRTLQIPGPIIFFTYQILFLYSF